MMSRIAAGCAGIVVALVWSAHADAQGAPQPTHAPLQATAPAGSGQAPLSVMLRAEASSTSVLACTKPACAAADYRALSFPTTPPATPEPSRAKLSVLSIGQGRSVLRIELGAPAAAWQALLAAPLGGGEPLVLWSGTTPQVGPGQADTGHRIEVAEGEGGAVTVLVGEVRGDMTLCGRPALLSPRMVHPGELTLKGVKMQRLTREERGRAEALTASRADSPVVPLSRLLTATGASSAIGSPAALTDGNTDTAWSEGRGGEGRGEFVVMRAASEVPIVALSLVIRPDKREVPAGASPKMMWIATDDRLLQVTLPEDGWTRPGAQYVVRPSAPLKTSCLAVVLDEAFVGKDPKAAAVTLTELGALSEFDGHTNLAGLVGALAGGGERAQAAAALLVRGGEPAHKAVVDAYDKLDEAGRHLAMGVIDNASCAASSKFFAARLGAAEPREREHARDRIRRCGRASAQALSEVMSSGTREQQWAAAEELATIDPADAIERLAPMLAGADDATRASIRTLLARASGQPRGMQALGKLLDDTSTGTVAAVDLLRSGSAHLDAVALPAGAAFWRLSRGELELRTRYLLCEPAARLAARGDTRAVRFLHDRLRDPEPMVRARAAEVSHGVALMRPYLPGALEDENVRVREAAATSIAGVDEGQPYLVRRLLVDEWPRVRARAADGLAKSGASVQSDQALQHAIFHDAAPAVRARVAAALGARHVTGAAPLLRDRADDAAEELNVRVKSVLALGQVCDRSSLDMLTVLAGRAAEPYGRESASELGLAATAALGRLHPADLQKRLEKALKGKYTPRHVRAAARAALQETDVCR